jgi:hypothetical protein
MRLKAEDIEKQEKTSLLTSGGQEWREGVGGLIKDRTNSPNSPITKGDTSRRRGSFLDGFMGGFDKILDAIGRKLREWVSAGTPEDPDRIAEFQSQLQEAGLYDGPVDGMKNDQLMSVIREMGMGG